MFRCPIWRVSCNRCENKSGSSTVSLCRRSRRDGWRSSYFGSTCSRFAKNSCTLRRTPRDCRHASDTRHGYCPLGTDNTSHTSYATQLWNTVTCSATDIRHTVCAGIALNIWRFKTAGTNGWVLWYPGGWRLKRATNYFTEVGKASSRYKDGCAICTADRAELQDIHLTFNNVSTKKGNIWRSSVKKWKGRAFGGWSIRTELLIGILR